jgi:hypothetical protein
MTTRQASDLGPTAADIKPVLPALRRMVLFPAKTIGTVSTETQVDLEQLEKFLLLHGKPTQEKLEAYEDVLAGNRPATVETVAALPSNPKTYPPKTHAPPDDDSARKAPRPAAPAAPTLQSPSAIDTVQSRPLTPAIRKVAGLLVFNPTLSQADACRLAEVDQATWSAFKVKRFGRGPLPLDVLSALVAASGVKAGDLPAVPPAPASVKVAATVARATAPAPVQAPDWPGQKQALEALLRASAALAEAAACLGGGRR